MSLPPHHLKAIDQIVREAASQGWSFCPQVLEEKELSAINDYFTGHRGTFVPARVGQGKERTRREEIRGDHTHWLDPLAPPAAFALIIRLLEELKTRLNRELFLGIKDFECHLAFYSPGSFYKTHVDRFSKDSSRVFSFVFYLHQEWQVEWGGELALYNRKGDLLKKITPSPGGLVCFLADDFPHEVLRGTEERRSLTGWMHTKIIN